MCAQGKMKHVVTRWSPFWNPTDQFEPKTIEVHCEILEKFQGEEQYVWWGKISKSGKLGMDLADVTTINEQIASEVEAHFYEYYSKVPHKIPFWFKLSDIRKLDFQQYLNSTILREEDGALFDPVCARPHHRIVYEDPPQSFFDYSLTSGRKWFMRGGMGAMIPRCFKTGGMICTNPEAQQAESRQRVFIGMPFRPEFENMYRYAIKPALDNLGLIPWKANEEIQNIDLMCKVCGGIQICASAIVDISDWNPNVMFELGLVYGLGKEAIIIKQKDAKVPVDLQGMIYVPYDDYVDLKDALVKYLAKITQ